MTKFNLFKNVLMRLVFLSASSIFILLIFHLFLLRDARFSNIFNNGYGIFHGWKCGNISGDLMFTLSVIGGLSIYIPSTIFCCIDYYFEKHKLLDKYKVSIPETKNITIPWDKYITAIDLVGVNSALSFFIVPVIIIPIMEWRGNCDTYSMLQDGATYNDIGFYLLKILCIGFVSDILFYCVHRSAHEIKYFYHNIHKIHHTFNNTFGIAASASHPLEHIFVNLFTVFGTPIILKMNCLSVFIYVWVASIATTYGHSGYDNPLNPLIYKFRKYTGNPHDFHHLYINCEYGSGYNEFMDTIFKTRIQDIYPKRWQKIQSNLNK